MPASASVGQLVVRLRKLGGAPPVKQRLALDDGACFRVALLRGRIGPVTLLREKSSPARFCRHRCRRALGPRRALQPCYARRAAARWDRPALEALRLRIEAHEHVLLAPGLRVPNAVDERGDRIGSRLRAAARKPIDDFAVARVQLHALAYNLGNFLRTLATPEPIKDWSMTTLKEKLIKIGAKVVSHGRSIAFQMAEVAIPKNLFADTLQLIAELRPPPEAALA